MKWSLIVLAGLGMSAVAADNPSSPVVIEENSLKQLLQIRRVYVDHLTGGETAEQMRDILLSSLERISSLCLRRTLERADATLKARRKPGFHRGAQLVGQLDVRSNLDRTHHQ